MLVYASPGYSVVAVPTAPYRKAHMGHSGMGPWRDCSPPPISTGLTDVNDCNLRSRDGLSNRNSPSAADWEA